MKSVIVCLATLVLIAGLAEGNRKDVDREASERDVVCFLKAPCFASHAEGKIKLRPHLGTFGSEFPFDNNAIQVGCPCAFHHTTHRGEDPKKIRWLTKEHPCCSEGSVSFIETRRGIQHGSRKSLDHSLLVWGSFGGMVSPQSNPYLPAMFVEGTRLTVQHPGPLSQAGVRLGSSWQTMFHEFEGIVPEDFQAGESDGFIEEST